MEACQKYATYELVETTHAGHAWTIANGLDLAATDAVLVVSGDGLMHEFLNGMMAREDLPAADDLPTLAIIPAGSGDPCVVPGAIEEGSSAVPCIFFTRICSA